jgi:hypothetical protein
MKVLSRISIKLKNYGYGHSAAHPSPAISGGDLNAFLYLISGARGVERGEVAPVV